MIKTKNKQELIEMVYKLEVENQNLKECGRIQHDLITDISNVYVKQEDSNIFQSLLNFIIIPFKLKKQLNKNSKYFYTYKLNKFDKMNQTELLEALDLINDYENKLISPVYYMDYIERKTGVNVCKSCGSTNDRIHNDFQRRVLNIMKASYPDLAQTVELVSGRYNNPHYINNIPFYTFKHLNNLIVKMENDLVAFKKRGITKAVSELTEDVKTMKSYVLKRKASTSIIPQEAVESTVTQSKYKVEVVVDEPIKVVKEVNKDTEELKEQVEIKESIKEVKEIIKNIPISKEVEIKPLKDVKKTIVKTITKKSEPIMIFNGVEHTANSNPTYDKAIKMRDKGMHLRKVANALGIEYKGLTSKLREYEERK